MGVCGWMCACVRACVRACVGLRACVRVREGRPTTQQNGRLKITES